MEQQPTKKRTDAIKERLQNYSDMVREFENQNERYVRLVTAMESPKVQSFDAMPGGGTAAGDRTTVNIARKIELEKSLEGDEKAINQQRTARMDDGADASIYGRHSQEIHPHDRRQTDQMHPPRPGATTRRV